MKTWTLVSSPFLTAILNCSQSVIVTAIHTLALITSYKNVFCILESERFKSFEIRQGYGLIAIVTVNFINFFMYCAKKAYMFWFFNPENVANCKISPSIAAEAVESAQVSLWNKIYLKPSTSKHYEPCNGK